MWVAARRARSGGIDSPFRAGDLMTPARAGDGNQLQRVNHRSFQFVRNLRDAGVRADLILVAAYSSTYTNGADRLFSYSDRHSAAKSGSALDIGHW